MVRKLFVYGSLMSGERNHGRLRGAKLFGEGLTAPRYTLVRFGAYPALLEGGSTSVRGEVYGLDSETLAQLDAFEGHPRLYLRKDVELEDGENVGAYVLRREHARGARPIAGGDWRHERRS